MSTEQLEFQAETRQLLDLMVHSIYSNKDSFLRELISNYSDALDKLRLESYRNKDLDVDVSDLHIEIDIDAAARSLTIRDTGIGMSRAEVARRFDGIIDFAELHESIDTPYKHLSNGMKVRLAFAVVSQLEEPILLVDEVLAVGDKAFREKCYTRIDELLAEGRTLFFVSHSEKDLRRFCERGLYLDKGSLVMDAPIADVLDRYNADYNEG